jgi:sulfatase maturation enzyme AslB (radical SAM superfamily)
LMKIFDEWVFRDVEKVFVQKFEAVLSAWYHLPASVCTF